MEERGKVTGHPGIGLGMCDPERRDSKLERGVLGHNTAPRRALDED